MIINLNYTKQLVFDDTYKKFKARGPTDGQIKMLIMSALFGLKIPYFRALVKSRVVIFNPKATER